MPLNFGLKQAQLEFILKLFTAHKILPQLVLVYGSRAKGNYRTESDLDLAILESTDTNLLGKLNEVLNESYELPFKVDLVLFETVTTPELKQEILQYGQPLVENPVSNH
jgi:uncharacterized protein